MSKEEILKKAFVPEEIWDYCYVTEDGKFFVPKYDRETGEIIATGEEIYAKHLQSLEQGQETEEDTKPTIEQLQQKVDELQKEITQLKENNEDLSTRCTKLQENVAYVMMEGVVIE